MKKDELITNMAKDAGISKKDAGAALESFIQQIAKSLKHGDKVTLTGFGTFEARTRSARDCMVPSTGETVHVSAHTVPAFKPGKWLKEFIE